MDLFLMQCFTFSLTRKTSSKSGISKRKMGAKFSCLMLCLPCFRKNLAHITGMYALFPILFYLFFTLYSFSLPCLLFAEKAPLPPHMEEAGACMPNGYLVSNDITSTLNEITMALTRPNIIKLGVYGSSNAKMDSVVEKIIRRVKRDNLFDLIVRASVKKKPELKRIQGEVGNMLGLQILEKTLEGRACLLCGKIKMVRRILIILDDVWGQIYLSKIGIPFGNNHNGCRILLISETLNVLSIQTNAQIKFTV